MSTVVNQIYSTDLQHAYLCWFSGVFEKGTAREV